MDYNILNIVGILILAVTTFMFLAIVLFAANRIRYRMGGSPLEKIERGVEQSMGGEEAGGRESNHPYGAEDCYRDCVKSSYLVSPKQYPSCQEICGLPG
jgi:hypothetical protein